MNHMLLADSGTLVKGEGLRLEVPNIKQNYTIGFQARIKEFDKVVVSHGKDKPYSSSFIEINSRAVDSYFYTTKEQMQESYTHNLEIREYINIIIKVLDDLTAVVILSSASGNYSCKITWKGCTGIVMAEGENSLFSDCKLTFYCSDYDKKIWGFGDSYFGRCPGGWPQIVNKWGYKNWMVDGFSGRKSIEALGSLKRCFDFGTPCKIIWALGMNDADSAEGINQDWLATIKKVEAYCLEKKIELILLTIPNVPKCNHKYKNEYIRKSGYRYVDIDHALGADLDNKWYQGLQDSDKEHPTAEGGLVIAMKIVMEIPELLS